MSRIRPDLEALFTARARVDSLLGHVQPDCLYDRPIPLRHRILFYIGHVEAFDWNLFSKHFRDLTPVCPAFERLFAFGIDPANESGQQDLPSDWPELPEVFEYRDKVRERTDAIWNDVPEQLRHVALEHRLMHAETLSYILHAMDPEKLIGDGHSGDLPVNGVPERDLLPVPEGSVTLGQSSEAFGWDNEFPAKRAPVESFLIDRFKVTNGDYLRFVEDGGPVPHFWRRGNGGWRLRRMFRETPLPLDWPVYTTWNQARAYADWRGAALPSEQQWHRAAYGCPGTDEERAFPWGDAPPQSAAGNFDFRQWDPAPVHSFPESASAFAVEDMTGNGWEWTSSLFRPFEGFEPFPFYAGYSAAFFDDDHYILKGGSPRTSATFLRRSFRNWFRSDYPWVFATFRCIQNQR